MAGNKSSGKASLFGDAKSWIENRQAELDQYGHKLEAAGRATWNQATRTGHDVAAATHAELVALGRKTLGVGAAPAKGAQPKPAASRAVAAPVRSAMPPPRPAAGAPLRPVIQNGFAQVLAAGRGMQDAATFGLGDRAVSGVLALADAARGAEIGEAYGRRMADERARDAYDREHYGIARTVGQVVGTGAQIAALGPLEGLALGGVRIAQATPMVARELAALGGVGGAAGVGGQALSDVLRGRIGSAGDYVGAAVGGAAGAVAARSGRGVEAGAVLGATTSVAQDVFNGRAVSVDDARASGLAGAALGAAGGFVGRRVSDSLSRSAKGDLGEDLSRVRTWARGDQTLAGPKSRQYLEGRKYTFPDQRTASGELVESKFGRSADLSKRQREAHAQLDNYRVDAWLPRDIGAGFGLTAADLGYRDYRPGP